MSCGPYFPNTFPVSAFPLWTELLKSMLKNKWLRQRRVIAISSTYIPLVMLSLGDRERLVVWDLLARFAGWAITQVWEHTSRAYLFVSRGSDALDNSALYDPTRPNLALISGRLTTSYSYSSSVLSLIKAKLGTEIISRNSIHPIILVARV